MTVTTDDIFNELWDVSYSCEKVECGIGGVKQEDELRKRWDALLSRARQEARREALKEMDEAWQHWEVKDVNYETHEWKKCYRIVEKLRQEYSNQP